MHLKTLAVLVVLMVGIVLARPDHHMGGDIDAKIEAIDRQVVKNWDDLIGPLSNEEKQLFRQEYAAEAEEVS